MKLYIAMLLLGTTINAQDNQEHTQVKTESVSTTGYSTLQKAALITGVIGVMLAAPFTPLVFKENREAWYDHALEATRKYIVNKIKNESLECCASPQDRIKHQLSTSLDFLAAIIAEKKLFWSFIQPVGMAAFSSLCQEFIDAEAHQTISKQYAHNVLAAVKKNIPEADIEKNQPIKKLIEILTKTTSS